MTWAGLGWPGSSPGLAQQALGWALVKPWGNWPTCHFFARLLQKGAFLNSFDHRDYRSNSGSPPDRLGLLDFSTNPDSFSFLPSCSLQTNTRQPDPLDPPRAGLLYPTAQTHWIPQGPACYTRQPDSLDPPRWLQSRPTVALRSLQGRSTVAPMSLRGRSKFAARSLQGRSNVAGNIIFMIYLMCWI